MEINFRPFTTLDLSEIEKLLEENRLPYKDVKSSKVEFFIAIQNERIIGCIGFENCNKNWLVRSFAVDSEFRKQNIGKKLLNELISLAVIKNVYQLHLLTTTADLYFKRNGFIVSARSHAPKQILETTEFSSLCPDSSIYMYLNLQKKKILVLCTGNSCRSQIAEGYLTYFAGSKATVFSAGVEIHGLNSKAVVTMKDDNIDISNHTSNHIDEYDNIDFDFVITVCDNAKERCPFFPTNAQMFHYNFPDPTKTVGTEEEIEKEFSKVRELIKEYSRKFIADHIA
jgi:arsenate reductase